MSRAENNLLSMLTCNLVMSTAALLNRNWSPCIDAAMDCYHRGKRSMAVLALHHYINSGGDRTSVRDQIRNWIAQHMKGGRK